MKNKRELLQLGHIFSPSFFWGVQGCISGSPPPILSSWQLCGGWFGRHCDRPTATPMGWGEIWTQGLPSSLTTTTPCLSNAPAKRLKSCIGFPWIFVLLSLYKPETIQIRFSETTTLGREKRWHVCDGKIDLGFAFSGQNHFSPSDCCHIHGRREVRLIAWARNAQSRSATRRQFSRRGEGSEFRWVHSRLRFLFSFLHWVATTVIQD